MGVLRLRSGAICLLLGAGLAAAQDAPPAKEPAPPPGPQDPPPAETGPAKPPFTPPAILEQRRKGLKHPASDAAVAAGVDWLLRHQRVDGTWSCHLFKGACTGDPCSGAGMRFFDTGVTALATLALLGAGRTHVDGPSADVLAKSLGHLVVRQDGDGCFSARTGSHFLYDHCVATMAVAEALWLTGDEKLIEPVARARDFLLAAKNPFLGWRYGIRERDNDTSMTTYAMVALRTCEFARVHVPHEVHAEAYDWLSKMTDRESGRVGYQERGGFDSRRDLHPSLPAKPIGEEEREVRLPNGMWVPRSVAEGRRLDTWAPPTYDFGRDARPPRHIDPRYPAFPWSSLTASAAFVVTVTAPEDEGTRKENLLRTEFVAMRSPRLDPWPDWRVLDLHALLFGSLLHVQQPLPKRKPEGAPDDWRPFRDAAVADLLATQRKKTEGCAAGSWDPDLDPFGSAGGRVYSTSMALLALQAPNRFPRVWDPKAKPPKPAKPEKR